MPEPAPGRAVALLARKEAWVRALDAMELHLDEIRAGLAIASVPAPYSVAAPEGPVPEALAGRARQILAAQHDVENDLRERLGTVSSILRGAWAATPTPVYLDRRD